MKLNFTLLFILTIFHIGQAQEFKKTKTYDPKIGSPEAELSSLAWITGHWKGEAFGGIAEEIWSAPLGGSMMASFKLVVGDAVQFYELETIIQENETLIFRLKHFHSNLKGWEEKDETVDFKLVDITPDAAYFDGLTFEKISESEMNVYVVVDSGTKKEEVKFNYHRVKN